MDLTRLCAAMAAAQALGHGPKLNVGPETLRKLTVQVQVDRRARPGPSFDELAKIKALKSQVRDLTEANKLAAQICERKPYLTRATSSTNY